MECPGYPCGRTASRPRRGGFLGNGRQLLVQLGAGRCGGFVLAGHDLQGYLVRQLQADLPRLRREWGALHEREHDNADHRDHQPGKPVAPGAQNARHLLLMRGPACGAGVVAQRKSGIEDRAEDADENGEHVEIAQLIYVEGVQEAFARGRCSSTGAMSLFHEKWSIMNTTMMTKIG